MKNFVKMEISHSTDGKHCRFKEDEDWESCEFLHSRVIVDTNGRCMLFNCSLDRDELTFCRCEQCKESTI